MKRKPKIPAARNPFVALAMKRKAGSHQKPEKAVRRAENVFLKGFSSARLEHPAFTRSVISSILIAPTKKPKAFMKGIKPSINAFALMAELVDAPDSKSGVERRVGSSPTLGTNV